ncbi:hypothetical protein [Pedobacter sp. MR22-3]|uniref:AbiJ-related protein n=1 Tax=Pedobacter sp. MR22-3 TaxID=2994552 RepID=UPI0022472C48|nr:hypothetical protein [Pedobacter sp. MR22-3]MCX2585936.1 hypothetical protein [Pedobacter sp. MR22-3]
MDRKLIDIVNTMSWVLSNEKAYQINAVCAKYKLSPEEEYQSPSGKEKYFKNLLLGHSESFLLELANKLVNDYKDDSLGFVLNEFHNGKFYKLSKVSRNELLRELFKVPDLQGLRTNDEFLDACDLLQFIPLNTEDFFASFIPGEVKAPNKELTEELRKINLQNKLDSRFFLFLEQVVHPYTRTNIKSAPLVQLINTYLSKDGLLLIPAGDISGEVYYQVVDKQGINEPFKNLIFAAGSYKPVIVLDDAISNRIRIVKNAEYCLVYDRTIKPNAGLSWVELVDWWSALSGNLPSREQAISLKDRLYGALASVPEQILFESYFSLAKEFDRKFPALIPQVYLHYDPYSVKQHGVSYLLRQRMDFLLLIGNARIVIEVDGKQHYAELDAASPRKYAEMVSLDRELKLLGYEVYRFGGFELTLKDKDVIADFFRKLFIKHQVKAK